MSASSSGPPPPARADVHAGGAVLWRGDPADPEVALVHRPAYDDWSIPKGKRRRGEQLVVTACREVAEETGYAVALGSPLPAQDYLVRGRRGETLTKHVRLWTARAGHGTPRPGPEVDELRWLPLAAARAMVTAERDETVLAAVDRPALTATTVLLAARLPRTATPPRAGGDLTHLLDLVRCFAPQRLLTAESTGCLRTAVPLATALRLPLEPSAVLHRKAQPGRADAAVRSLRQLGVDGGGLVVAGASVVAALTRDLAAVDGLPLPWAGADRGGVWALRLCGGRLLSAEYLLPTRPGSLPLTQRRTAALTGR